MTAASITDAATLVSTVAAAVYAVVSAISLLLLSRQMRDARRFGAAPALLALLKESEEHMAAVRSLRGASADDGADSEVITRYLEFFERVEHLRSAGVLPSDVLRRAFGSVLQVHLADDRFRRIVDGDPHCHGEVLRLAKHLAESSPGFGTRMQRES